MKEQGAIPASPSCEVLGHQENWAQAGVYSANKEEYPSAEWIRFALLDMNSNE